MKKTLEDSSIRESTNCIMHSFGKERTRCINQIPSMQYLQNNTEKKNKKKRLIITYLASNTEQLGASPLRPRVKNSMCLSRQISSLSSRKRDDKMIFSKGRKLCTIRIMAITINIYIYIYGWVSLTSLCQAKVEVHTSTLIRSPPIFTLEYIRME